MYTVGGTASAILSAYLPDNLGRRWPMLIGNVILICGVLCCSLAPTVGAFIGGRFLTGVGTGLASCAAKSYLSEITPPATRGRWMGLNNSFYYFGQIIATGTAVPFGYKITSWAWRGPIILQACPAVVNALFIMFMPESPRWFYAHGQKEKATRILADLHSRNKDINSPLVRIQIGEIEESISLHGGDKRWWDPRPLVNTRSQRYRAWMTIIVAIWQTLAGNGLITYFLPTLLGNAGIKDTNKQRQLNVVNSCTSMIGAFTGVMLIDYVGRRKLMLFSSGADCVNMAIISGLLSKVSAATPGRTNTGIAWIFLWAVFHSAGWTPMTTVYPVECLTYENRAKGLAFWGVIQSALACINTFGLPVAIVAMGWKVYLMFVFVNLVGVVVEYIWCVETKRLSLEDLEYVFTADDPKKASFELIRVAKERAKAARSSI